MSVGSVIYGETGHCVSPRATTSEGKIGLISLVARPEVALFNIGCSQSASLAHFSTAA